MKVHIVKPTYHFELIKNLLSSSFTDLGHKLTNEKKEADLIIAIRTFPENLKKEDGQKVVLMQTEPYKISPHHEKERNIYGAYHFGRHKADAYWGFDKSDENESYLILGYHPSLDFTSKGNVTPKHPVGFIGCSTERRRKLFDKSKYTMTYISTWDIEKGIFSAKRCKINVHLNAWDKREALTPWDRITRYLHNKCFFIMEDVCDCPINQIVRFDLPNYENVLNEYMGKDKLREEIAEECYRIYKKDFDMRNILQQKLDELGTVQ